MSSFVPRYYEIQQALRVRIAELEPDAPLPSDAQLCEEFAVSRMTARNAVQQLVQEGLVYRIPGKGTFVADAGTHRQTSTLTNFSKEMRRRGRRPTSRLLELIVRQPTAAERARLQLGDGETVVALGRLRLADGEPIAIERAVVRGDAGVPLATADLELGSLHEALTAAGFVPTRGTGTIVAERATAPDAKLLDVPRGWPLLVERRLILDQEGTPLEATESRYPSGRYALDVEFDVERTGADG